MLCKPLFKSYYGGDLLKQMLHFHRVPHQTGNKEKKYQLKKNKKKSMWEIRFVNRSNFPTSKTRLEQTTIPTT